MPEISSSAVLKQVLKDISSIQELIDDSCVLKKALKKIDSSERESNRIAEKTKDLIEKLKSQISKIDTYFEQHVSTTHLENEVGGDEAQSVSETTEVESNCRDKEDPIVNNLDGHIDDEEVDESTVDTAKASEDNEDKSSENVGSQSDANNEVDKVITDTTEDKEVEENSIGHSATCNGDAGSSKETSAGDSNEETSEINKNVDTHLDITDKSTNGDKDSEPNLVDCTKDKDSSEKSADKLEDAVAAETDETHFAHEEVVANEKEAVMNDGEDCADSNTGNTRDEDQSDEVELKSTWKIKCVDISKLISPNLGPSEAADSEPVVILSDSDGGDTDSTDREVFSDKLKNLRRNDALVQQIEKNKNITVTRQCKNVIVLDDSDSSDEVVSNKTKASSRKTVMLPMKSTLLHKILNGKYDCATEKENGESNSDTLKKRKSVRFDVSNDSKGARGRKFTRSQTKPKKITKDTSSSDDETCDSNIKKKLKKKQPKDVINVSSFSDTNSDSESDSTSTMKKSGKKKKAPTALESRLKSSQTDDKFSWRTYVPLTRIVAAKLKLNYEKRLLKDEINRLTNMDTLKRSRHASKGSQSSDSTDSTEVKKKCMSSRTAMKKTSTSSSASDQSTCEADPLGLSDMENGDTTGAASANKDDDNVLTAILGGINSGTEHDSGSDSKSSDTETNEPKKSNMVTETKQDKNVENKTDDPKESADKDAEKESARDSSDDEEIRKRKTVRKDKLLTENLSGSDSEDNFDKFTKKKDKLAEELSDTEDLAPKKTVKRTGKRKARIVVNSDSDSSYSNKNKSSDDNKSDKESSQSSDAETTKDDTTKNTKRRRIKALKDSSEEENDRDDKSTRKHIRRVWTNDSLAETTKQAEKEEEARKARIADRQKRYNQIFESSQLEKATVDKLVLDFDEDTKEELLKVDKKIVKHLKPHQAKGVHFMWDACFESLKRAKSTKGSGCILAHCMGLGKTLQIIALTHALIAKGEETGVSKVLVVTPLNTVLNWVAEFKKWQPSDDNEVEVFEIVSYKQNYERQYQVQEWSKHGGVLILGYDMFRNLTNPNNKRMPKKMRNIFQSCLVDPGPDLVVCDEGHLLKNEKTSISIAMNRLRTLRRIVLTGTPLQNNLKEYFCMVQFVKPNLLGTYKEYLNRFVNPITNGQYTDSTPHDIQIMRKRSHVLHKLLDGLVQRRDYSVLAPFLPPKYEYVLFISLTDIQIKLYEHYLREKSRIKTSNKGKSFLFIDFQELQRICTHPRVLLDKSIEVKLARDKQDFLDDEEDSEGSLKDFIDDSEDTSSNNSSSSNKSDSENESHKKPRKSKRVTRATAVETIESDKEEQQPAEPDPSEWWKQYCEKDELDSINYSGKLFLLFEILHECEQMGDKILVFSQSLYSLNVIEYFLRKVDEESQLGDEISAGGHPGSWALGLDYFRLDGSSSCDNRASWCKTFNSPENTRARLFLISTRAGGLGINLVAANRVIIFDVSWNPSHDIQSIYRIYRFGQNKPCYIYRFVTLGTMEMKIYERQIIKQAISKRVIDEQQIDRHYNQNDLAELYRFEPKPDEDRPIPLVPKDILLGELLQKHESRIFKYHEHQSLLENKEDEGLDEEERKAAWEEFEYEKKARQFPNIINNIPIGTIVMALTSIIQKDNPTWDNSAVQSVVPQLVKELEQQLQFGNMTMYNRVFNEVRLIQSAKQQQRMQEMYFRQQQQAMMMRQYQQQLLNPNAGQYPTALNPFAFNMPRPNIPGSSTNQSRLAGTSEIIDLND